VFATLAVTTATLAGCGGAPASEAATVEAASLEIMSQQADFWAALQALSGQAFAGTLAEGAPSDTAFAGKAMVMHVRECAPEEIKIPFHVGEDHSRTWVLTQTETGLRLKHDHRLSDGSEDEVTQYGGDTRDTGSATKQEFYADAFTAELIDDTKLPARLRLGAEWMPDAVTSLTVAWEEELSAGALVGGWERVTAVGAERRFTGTRSRGIVARAGYATDFDGSRLLSAGVSLGPVQLAVARTHDRIGGDAERRSYDGWVASLGLVAKGFFLK
jgi:hypothetical protein